MDADFKLLKSIKNSHLFEKGGSIVVGVSGGVDSVVLLDALATLQREYHLKLYVAHVNYGLRGRESDRDEKFVRELAKKYGIKCCVKRNPPQPPFCKGGRKAVTPLCKGGRKAVTPLCKGGRGGILPSTNLQNSARDIRYDFFLKVAKKIRANKIAIAHHANDQAETMLIHLTRGAGLAGLTGMSPARDFANEPLENRSIDCSCPPPNGRRAGIYGAKRPQKTCPINRATTILQRPLKLVRPLLNLTKEDIIQYARARKLGFVQDRTNRTKKYHRNVIRHDLLPLLQKYNPNIVQHLCKTAAILRDENEALNEIASSAFHPRGGLSSPRKRLPAGRVAGGPHACNFVHEIPAYYRGNDNKIVFNRARFLKHNIAIRRRILRLAYAKLTGGTTDLLTDHIDKMMWIIASGKKDGRYSLPKGVKFIRKGDAIILQRSREKIPKIITG